MVLVDGRDDTEFWKGYFKRVEKLGEVEVERFGYPLATYEIYFGDGYEAPN